MEKDPRNIRLEDYTYELPDEKIARYPLRERDSSKLLIYRSGNISQDIFRNIGNYLNTGDVLVCNRTKVIRARLIFRKKTGSSIEIFCLEPVYPQGYERNFSSGSPVEWKCLVGNRKKWKEGTLSMSVAVNDTELLLTVKEVTRAGAESILRFSWDSSGYSFSDILDAAGHIPVPPYLKREDEEIDRTRYQTVYSMEEGSVAAPTAGLHFTDNILKGLNSAGIDIRAVTLHVGAGTFRPVKTDTIGEHEMHIEHFRVEKSVLESIRYRRVIAVGTTSLRTLESLYWIGHKISHEGLKDHKGIFMEQWYPYDNNSDAGFEEYVDIILDYMRKKGLDYLEARTAIIIVPGYRIRVAKGLITNYHMPGSTLLLLVAALAGDNWRDIYDYSLKNDFRFLSYGDSSLLLP